MNRKSLVGLSAMLALTLSGCGTQTPTDANISPSRSVSTQPTDTPAPADITPINGDNWLSNEASKSRSDATPYDSLLTGLQLAEHDTFYRAVLQFQGQEEPAWYVNWVDEAISEGSGNPIEVPGTAILQISITGMMTPETEEQLASYYQGPSTLTTGPIALVYDTTFEGSGMFYIGLAEKHDFQVGLLQNPMRVVIDITKD